MTRLTDTELALLIEALELMSGELSGEKGKETRALLRKIKRRYNRRQIGKES
jgi:hypothetical protein